jgi:hypothetical protein
MKDKLWFVAPKTKDLASAYEEHPATKRIVAAEAFTVSLRTVMVAQDMDGFLRGDNDVLVLSAASLGEKPAVQRVHYYEEELPAGTVLKDFIAETMYVCDDYSGTDRLWMELNIVEVDTDTGERKALLSAFKSFAVTAGAVFPATLPYSMAASGIFSAIEKLVSALETDEPALKVPVTLYPPDRMGAPLQRGSFVVFANPVEGGDYELQANGELAMKSGGAVVTTYVVFTAEPVKVVSPEWIISQRVATLLTQITEGNRNTAKGSVDFLNDTLQLYSNFSDLRRYLGIMKRKEQGSMTAEEKALMDRIGVREELKPFLPK